MTVVLTGGSGFIGSALSRALLEKGHTVVVIDKKSPDFTHQNLYFIQCDLEENMLPFNVLERTDAIIHLAGRTIFGKWTDKVKNEIEKSRIVSTKHLVKSLEKTATRPSIFICASATGYYGDKGDEDVDEQSSKGTTFLSHVTERWEEEAMKAEQFGCRVVLVRTAPVIGSSGFLKPLLQLARLGIVLRLVRKDFWMSWVHIDDVVRIYLFALETNTLQGIVNASSPMPVKSSDFMKLFARATHRRVIGALPKFLSKLLYGEFIHEIVLSQKAYPRRLIDKGFDFEYVNIEGALRQVTDHAKKQD